VPEKRGYQGDGPLSVSGPLQSCAFPAQAIDAESAGMLAIYFGIVNFDSHQKEFTCLFRAEGK
jgi:hypothetical protein